MKPYIELSESTLYTILKRLETADMLTVRTAEHGGRLRKYYHITDNMQRSAADKIERGFGRNEVALGKNGQTPDKAPETPVRAKFEPKQPKIRRPGTGCIFRISEKKWEGSYSPKLPNGKRKKFNIYADTREECEERLSEMIKQKNAEIAAEKEKLKSRQNT